jgi:hypothetical protein
MNSGAHNMALIALGLTVLTGKVVAGPDIRSMPGIRD